MVVASIYAEYLPNLKQVSVNITLTSPCNVQTRAVITDDGNIFSFSHEGHTYDIDLPSSVPNQSINLASHSKQDICLRFSSPPTHDERNILEPEPWTAPRLPANVSVICAACQEVIVRNVREWKDLPSGGWADMMELWHCHKPDVPNANGNAGLGKGYGAGNSLQPGEGVGLVDAGAFLFLKQGCEGAQVSMKMHFYGLCPPQSTIKVPMQFEVGRKEGDLLLSLVMSSIQMPNSDIDLDEPSSPAARGLEMHHPHLYFNVVFLRL